MAVTLYPTGVLQTAQTGNADSTNTIQLNGNPNARQLVLRIVSTIGATPTVTVNIKGSVDGTTFYNIPYIPIASQGEYTTAAVVITTAVTTLYLLAPYQSYNFIKLVMTLNTNVTLTSDVL